MSTIAWFATGLAVGLFIAGALLLDEMVAHRKQVAHLEALLMAERMDRCARGQHREVLETKTPHMYLFCTDCDWREEVGIAYQTGTNKTRPAA